MKLMKWTLIIAGLFILLGLAQYCLSHYYVYLINLIGINIILVISLNITNGYTGLFSLGHAGLMSIGAYVTGLLTQSVEYKTQYLPLLPSIIRDHSLPFLPAMLIGATIAMMMGFVFAFPALRLKGHYLALATLGFGEIVRVVNLNLVDYTGGPLNLRDLPPYTNVFWVFGLVLVTIFVVQRLINSRIGRAWIAIREDQVLAETIGIKLTYYKILSFLVGAFFAGLGGALWGHLITALNPDSFGLLMTFNLLTMMILGGAGKISGAIVGAIVMTILPEILRPLELGGTLFGISLPRLYGLPQVIISTILILVIILRPQGIMGGTKIIQIPFFSKKN